MRGWLHDWILFLSCKYVTSKFPPPPYLYYNCLFMNNKLYVICKNVYYLSSYFVFSAPMVHLVSLLE
jgi:hypothetical protein